MTLKQINVREHPRGNKSGQSRETGIIWATQDTGRRQTKQKTHHYIQTNTNNVNKT